MKYYIVDTKSKRSSQQQSYSKTTKKRDKEMIARKNWISTVIIISCKRKICYIKYGK